MIFSNARDYGISEEIFLNSTYKAYINFAVAQTDLGATPGNATSISRNKIIALKKCYSEYLERYSMGLAIGKKEEIKCFDCIKHTCVSEEKSHFAYGNSLLGHSDTTGTAAGTDSEYVAKKSMCELIEKNDLFCFWYGNSGYEISNEDFQIINTLKIFDFISDTIRIYVVKEISNFPTAIALGLKNDELITTGICCSSKITEAVYGAISEAKIIEWQQYRNKASSFKNVSSEFLHLIRKRINRPSITFAEAKKYDSVEQDIIFSSWVKSVRLKVIFCDIRYNLKVVKAVSDELMISVPTLNNISQSNGKEIIKRYFINTDLDCPVV